ncbi:HNH endonuclease signature motif containing protein [Streptomyces sp. NPDC055966]|uniref:HNH endonuclease signature motif containing protein n=1 Tax=Streptomyces sp. NPDC055966 TaxID=3345669 RepID=UPI0035DE0517
MTVRTGGVCTVKDCEKPKFGRGWCQMHYARWQDHGDPLHPVQRYVRQGATCSVDGCDSKPRSLGMCGTHGDRFRRYGETTEPRERRFWAKVDKDGPIPEQRPDLGPCWVWTGYINSVTGYGNFGGRKAGTQLVHRIAYQYLVGPIPAGKHLDHLCRRRECLRPSHLEPVTPRENIRRGDQGAFWGYVHEAPPPPPKAPRPDRCTECGGDKPIYKRTLCRPCYRRWLKDPSVERPSKRTAEQRFWEKVEKTDSCWLWIAGINRHTGYGRFGLRHGQMVDAHRYAYEIANGPIPEKHDVHHTCHVRHCVNPSHLEAVTRSENLRLRKVRRA